MASAAALGMAMLIGAGLSVLPAQAAYIVTLTQVGSNVVAKGNGTIDLAGLKFDRTPFLGPSGIIPNSGYILTGPPGNSTIFSGYTGLTGPASFGSGGEADSNSGSGDLVGINGSLLILFVPRGYVSGSALSDSATYVGRTLIEMAWVQLKGPSPTESLAMGLIFESLFEPASWPCLVRLSALLLSSRRRPGSIVL